MARQSKQETMFGDNFKYVLILTILAWMTYTMPSVKAAFQSADAYNTNSSTAAVAAADAKKKIAMPELKVSAKNLVLSYAAKRKEGLLTATFKVSISGGHNGVFVYPNAIIWFQKKEDSGFTSANSSRVTFAPTSQMKLTTVNGEQVYSIGAGKTVLFNAVATVDPRQLFAGSYTAVFSGVDRLTVSNGESVRDFWAVSPVSTNAKVIVGEISPYITSVTNPIKVGDKMLISGQRLNDAKDFGHVYIDGVQVLGVDGTKTGEGLFFVLGPEDAGWHTLYVINANGQSNTVGFNVEGEVTPVQASISLDASSPEAGVVLVSDTEITEDLVLLVGKLKIDGTDATVLTMPISLSTDAPGGLAAVISNVTLKIGAEEYTKSVTSTAGSDQIMFDGFDYLMSDGTTIPFTVKADIRNLTDGFQAGNGLSAALTDNDRNALTVIRRPGVPLLFSEKTGTAIGERQEFQHSGIVMTPVLTSTYVLSGENSNDDIGIYSIDYKITANGGDAYISSVANPTTIGYIVDKAGLATSSNAISAVLYNETDTTLTAAGNYVIEDGKTDTFQLVVSVPMGNGFTAGQYRTSLSQFRWSTTDTATPENVYVVSPELRTSYVVLN